MRQLTLLYHCIGAVTGLFVPSRKKNRRTAKIRSYESVIFRSNEYLTCDRVCVRNFPENGHHAWTTAVDEPFCVYYRRSLFLFRVVDYRVYSQTQTRFSRSTFFAHISVKNFFCQSEIGKKNGQPHTPRACQNRGQNRSPVLRTNHSNFKQFLPKTGLRS